VSYPRGNIVVIDTETSGLNAWDNNKVDKKGNLPGARIFCFAYFTELGEFGFMMKNPKNLRWLKRFLNDKRKTIVFQNAKFDLEMLWFEGFDILNLKAHIDDILIMSKVLRSTAPSHDLVTLNKKILGNYNLDDKDEIVQWLKENGREFKKLHGRKPNFSDAPIEIVKRRVLFDVETTFYIHQKLKPLIEETCPELYETERRLIFVCIDMELYGVKIDITRAEELRAQAIKDLAMIYKDLNKLVLPIQVTRTKKGQKVTETISEEFNPGSGQHITGAFQKLGIPLLYKTKPKKSKKGKTGKTGGGNWSFDEYAMIRYVSKPLAGVIRDSGEEGWAATKFYKEVYRTIEEHEFEEKELLPPLILKYRQVQKMISTYYDHFINDCTNVHIESNGRKVGILHCKFNQSVASTGRFCLAKGTQIQIPGTTKNIEDIRKGDWVYCYDKNLDLKLKKVTWSGKTGYKRVIRVHWLSSNHRKTIGYIDLTPQHQIRLISGKYVKAQNLNLDDRVLSLTRSQKIKSKPRNVLCYRKHRKIPENRLVFQLVNGYLPEIVHHRDEDPLNDNPSNLQDMTEFNHKSYHGSKEKHYQWMDISKDTVIKALVQHQWSVRQAAKFLNVSCPLLRRRLSIFQIDIKSSRNKYLNRPTDKQIKKALITNKGVISKAARILKITRPQLDYRLKSFNILNNHIITKIEYINKRVSVYDIEVNGEHNFIANEICVHNSSSEINLQNQPRLLGPRECIIPRKGRRNYHADYEQVEMRFFVHFSGDEIMAAAIDEDIHLTVAAEIYNKPKKDVTKEQRKRAKGTNFGIIYGAGGPKIAETLTRKGLPTSGNEGNRLTSKYHYKFPSVKRTTKKLGTELKQYGYITNPFGRRYHIPTKFAYIALNYMCQGTSADLMKRAMVEIWEWLRATNKISRLILTVHDELVFECPRIEEREVISKVIEIMEELEMFKIPMTVSVDVVTKRWSEKIKPESLGLSFS